MTITFRMMVEAVAAALLLFSIAAIIFAVRRVVRRPPSGFDGAGVFTVVAAHGDANHLEQTVQGILWRSEGERVNTHIIIADCGLDEHSRKLAELLARDTGRVTLCTPGEIAFILEENGWMKGT